MDSVESVYAPRGTPNPKQRARKDTPISNTFDPFIWDPPNPELGGGAWVPPTPPMGTEGVVDVTEGLLSSKVRGGSPSFMKSLMLQSRDKESLLEEIIRLKRMLIDQAFYLKRDKVHASTVQIENRKLENDIKDMEMAGNQPAFKAGGSSRVRAKLQGMKTRYEDLQNLCDSQHEEITHLRRDVRISHAREIEMERDVFVEEIAKLQKDVKRLKHAHSQLCCENKDLTRIRDKAGDLEALNHHLENCMEVVNKALDRANRDVVTYRQRLTESNLMAKRNAKRYKDLEDQIALLRNCLEQEKADRQSLEERRVVLEDELMKVEQRTRACGGTVVSSATPNPDKSGTPKSNSLRSARTI